MNKAQQTRNNTMMTVKQLALLVTASLASPALFAADDMNMPASDSQTMPMPSGSMNPSSGMNTNTMDSMNQTGGMNNMGSMNQSSQANPMGDMNMNMDMSGMQGGSAPPDARSPDYSDGYDFGPIPRPVMADEKNFAALMVNQLETVKTSDNSSSAYDLEAWFGLDYNRAVLKAEGEVDAGKLQDARTELLWSHAITAFWDTQLGARLDSGEDPNRNWLAFGVQGLAPYWFEVEATGYLGENSRSAIRLDASYELLFTQRLILEPRAEANIYGKDDVERGLGSGLSDITVGLRLRYEIRREIAPYLGVEWAGSFGKTADLAEAAGADTTETRLVAGLRFWF